MFCGIASASFVHRLKARAAGKELDARADFRARQDDSWEVSGADLAPGPSSFGTWVRLHIVSGTFEVAADRPRAHIRIGEASSNHRQERPDEFQGK